MPPTLKSVQVVIANTFAPSPRRLGTDPVRPCQTSAKKKGYRSESLYKGFLEVCNRRGRFRRSRFYGVQQALQFPVPNPSHPSTTPLVSAEVSTQVSSEVLDRSGNGGGRGPPSAGDAHALGRGRATRAAPAPQLNFWFLAR